MKIAIQGVKAAFHDVAARKYFSGRDFTALECLSFPLLAQHLSKGTADLAVMAIENSIAGSILPNYSLMEANGFQILGEVYLRIQMNLMAQPGVTIEDLRYVQSHPMALLQCQDFLAQYPHLSVMESADTAESARVIKEKNLRDHAAIASRLAAETYGLNLLAEGIESNSRNYTRFLVICRGNEASLRKSELAVMQPSLNKASIRFEVKDRPGALARVLDVFHRCGVNMTKIQSIPILGRPYEYSFHVDLEWQSYDSYEKAMREISPEVIHLIHFGEYPKSERPTS